LNSQDHITTKKKHFIQLALVFDHKRKSIYSVHYFVLLFCPPSASDCQIRTLKHRIMSLLFYHSATTTAHQLKSTNDQQSSLFFHNINYDEKNKVQLLFDHWLNENERNTKNILKNKILKQNVFRAIGFYNEADTLEYWFIRILGKNIYAG
jgi:hypothetical protein